VGFCQIRVVILENQFAKTNREEFAFLMTV